MNTNWLFAQPQWLTLLPLAVLPWLIALTPAQPWSWLATIPKDSTSVWIERGLRLTSSLAISAAVLALAAPARQHAGIERSNEGAHIAFIIDRSGSMNSTFAGRTVDGTEESKATAARRLLKNFVSSRSNDRIGVVAFSTSPMLVLPMTDRLGAVEAAIDAIDRPGLTHTDVARGLAMAFELFNTRDTIDIQSIVLVSDGAAVIDRRVQESLRAAFARHPVRLYWLFLRTARSSSIFDQPNEPGDDTPQMMPERHLHLFFQTLGVPYQAFEAEDAQGLAKAIDTIDHAERKPIRFIEAAPRENISWLAFLIALLASLLLLTARLLEVANTQMNRQNHEH
ncbi:MAG: vWA domain-containing protein [Parahaliea sp.]